MNSLVSCKHCHILLKNVFAYICDHFHMIWLQKCEIITYRNQSVIPFRVGRRKKKFPALPLDTFGIILHRVSHLIEGQGQRSKVSLSLSPTFSAAKFEFNSSLHLFCPAVCLCPDPGMSQSLLTVRSTLCIAYVYISGLQKKEVKFIIVKSVIWWSLCII